MAWVRGQSGNPKGRPPGAKDKVQAEIRNIARGLFDKAYWEGIRTQLATGELHPTIHRELLRYAYGNSGEDHAKAGVTVNLGFINTVPTRAALEPADGSDTVVVIPAHSLAASSPHSIPHSSGTPDVDD